MAGRHGGRSENVSMWEGGWGRRGLESLLCEQPCDSEWMEAAGCAGLNPDLFYPDLDHRGAYEEARKACSMCKIRPTCAEKAIRGTVLQNASSHYAHGMWGGLTPNQRLGFRDRAVHGVKPVCGHVSGVDDTMACALAARHQGGHLYYTTIGVE